MSHAFISRIHEQQLALAKTITEELYHLPDGVLDFSQFDQPGTPHVEPTASASDLVKRGDFLIWVQDALREYSNWLAARMFRLADYRVWEPIEPTAELCDLYEQNYGRPKAFVRVLHLMLIRTDRQIPLLGELKDGRLHPDRETIQRWAVHHGWA